MYRLVKIIGDQKIWETDTGYELTDSDDNCIEFGVNQRSIELSLHALQDVLDDHVKDVYTHKVLFRKLADEFCKMEKRNALSRAEIVATLNQKAEEC